MTYGLPAVETSGRSMRFKTIVACFLTLILLAVSAARAATLTLNDGTVLEGTIIKTADGYWVKLSDGSSKIVAKEDVKSYSGDAGSNASPGSPASLDDSSQACRVAREHADEADSAACRGFRLATVRRQISRTARISQPPGRSSTAGKNSPPRTRRKSTASGWVATTAGKSSIRLRS